MNHNFPTIGTRCHRHQVAWLVIGMIGWFSFVLGCVPSKVQVQSAPQFDPSSISSIAILPFQALQAPQWGYGQTREVVRVPEEIRMQFRLPGGDQVRPSDSSEDRYAVSDTAARFITSQVESILRTRTLRVVGAGESSLAAPTDDVSSDTSLRVLAKEVGDRLKVDAVLMGKVRTYREREGTRLGAKPAAVGFEIFLVKPSDGTVLWKGDFFEEQKPLTQDVVGFFEKSGGFVTARELSELGVRKVLETFPVGKGAPPVR
jgi:TolB-like protein